MGFKACGISPTTRFKRPLSTSGRSGSGGFIKVLLDSDNKRINSTSPRSPSPTAAPFNSTSFLIQQKSHHREEEAPGAFKQYGSNVGSMITCCSFARDRDCGYQSQAQHPIIVGMSNLDSRDDVALLHLQLQGLQVADCPDHCGHKSSSDSGSRMEIDDSSTARDQGDKAFEHRRVRSFTDDNFDLLFQSNASALCDLLEDGLFEDGD